MSTPAAAPVVRLLGLLGGYDRTGFVILPGEPEVRVRFLRGNGPVQWRCDTCGKHRFSTCRHELAMRDAIRVEVAR